MKLINTSNKPYEFTWDGGHYGPYKPGQIVDLPDDMAHHALRKSAILEQQGEMVGEVIGFQMEMLDGVSREKVKEIASFDCPYTNMGLCTARQFKTPAELKAHLLTHPEFAPESNPARLTKQ